jgi:hypothetical protein
MRHLSENRHVLGPDFDVRFNVQKSVADDGFQQNPLERKKRQKPLFPMLTTK